MASLRLPLWLRLVLLVGVLALAIRRKPACLSILHASGHAQRRGRLDRRRGRQDHVGYRQPSSSRPMRRFGSRSSTAARRLKPRMRLRQARSISPWFAATSATCRRRRPSSSSAIWSCLIVAPPGSTIDGIDKLKGRRVGVISGDANSKIVDVLSKDLWARSRQDIQEYRLAGCKEGDPVQRGCSAARRDPPGRKIFVAGARLLPAGLQNRCRYWSRSIPPAAIAESERAYESFDVPKGTLRGSPPVPDDDLTTLRTSLYLVANKKLGSDLVTRLTQSIMSARRDLMGSSRSSRRSRPPAPIRMPTCRCIPERRPSTTAPRRASWMNTATGST